MDIPDDIRKEVEEMNNGIVKALDILNEIHSKGLIDTLRELLDNEETNELIQQWIDMTIVLGIQNKHIHMKDPLNIDDESMIVDGNMGIRDLILKGFVYGLYWKTKALEADDKSDLEIDKLEKMWNKSEDNWLEG